MHQHEIQNNLGKPTPCTYYKTLTHHTAFFANDSKRPNYPLEKAPIPANFPSKSNPFSQKEADLVSFFFHGRPEIWKSPDFVEF